MQTPHIEVMSLRKEFGGLMAVFDVSFSVDPGEIVAIIASVVEPGVVLNGDFHASYYLGYIDSVSTHPSPVKFAPYHLTYNALVL